MSFKIPCFSCTSQMARVKRMLADIYKDQILDMERKRRDEEFAAPECDVEWLRPLVEGGLERLLTKHDKWQKL